MRACVRACKRVLECVGFYDSVCVCVRACVCSCVRACVRACVCMCVRLLACGRAVYMRVDCQVVKYVCARAARVHACQLVCVRACVRAYLGAEHSNSLVHS